MIERTDEQPEVCAEEVQRLLLVEINHRVRNMLQVVIGLANQTLHRSENLQQFEHAFMGRMQALARAYDLLSRTGWKEVPVAELLRSQLAAFATEGGRYSAHGEPVLLNANAALAIGLVLHELAMNASKYGALSVSSGHVDVSWQLQSSDGQPELTLRWVERGGPPVAPPARHGLGSELMQRQLKHELNGRASMQFAPEGFSVTLAIPATGAVVKAAGDAAAGGS